MNRLHPDLKRLIDWAKRSQPLEPPEVAPFGFAGRVVASRNRLRSRTLLSDLQGMALASACLSVVVILCGLIVLARQDHAPEPANSLPSALSFVASNLHQ